MYVLVDIDHKLSYLEIDGKQNISLGQFSRLKHNRYNIIFINNSGGKSSIKNSTLHGIQKLIKSIFIINLYARSKFARFAQHSTKS